MSSPTSLARQVAGEVRAEMARQRKTSSDLATALGTSQSSASRRLTGETAFDLDEVAVVADWLNIPISQVLRRGHFSEAV